MHKARLLGVWQGPAGDPAQQRHQLAPIAHAQAERVWPAKHHGDAATHASSEPAPMHSGCPAQRVWLLAPRQGNPEAPPGAPNPVVS